MGASYLFWKGNLLYPLLFYTLEELTDERCELGGAKWVTIAEIKSRKNQRIYGVE